MRAFADLTPTGQARRLHGVAASLLARYSLAGARLRLLSQTQGVVYRVDAPRSRPCVLRLRPTDAAADALGDAQLRWLSALASATPLVVPTPIAAQTGTWSVRVDAAPPALPGPWRCVLLRWVHGRRYEQLHRLPVRAAAAIGTTTAALHTHAQSFALPPAVPVRRWDCEAFVGADSCLGTGAARAYLAPDDYAVLVEARASVRAACVAAGERSEASGLIHADLGLHNFVFAHGDARPIDFDEWGYGPYLYDLAAPLRSLLALERYDALREALLAAYARAHPLPQTALDHLDAFVTAQCFGYLTWLFACVPRRSEWATQEVAKIKRLCRL